jgi:hypothetical protein
MTTGLKIIGILQEAVNTGKDKTESDNALFI